MSLSSIYESVPKIFFCFHFPDCIASQDVTQESVGAEEKKKISPNESPPEDLLSLKKYFRNEKEVVLRRGNI